MCFLGKPIAKLTWWRDEILLPPIRTETTRDGVVVTSVEIKNIKRNDNHAVFICQATNNIIINPAGANFTLEMRF